jgi:DNA invertase Pin-like site-specific DNA recombinase
LYAIYARQSVDKADSISIESQIEYCEYELRGQPYKTYQDKGYSGKNTQRPAFKELLSDIKGGEIHKVIVYKLDRISRSILDFSNMMQVFEKHQVEFISCTEKFDTSTPMGRAMLNICIVFAQLERETIQKRVADAYYSRSQKGLYMGGRVPYGFHMEQTVIGGIKTSKYVVNPEEAEQIKLLYELYADPHTSYGDVIQYISDHRIKNLRNHTWNRTRISEIIKNPIYVRADLDIYEFYKAQETIIANDAGDFLGTNGCYLYSGKEAKRKTVNLKGQNLVIAPHEGIVSSDIWLKCRKKCLGRGESKSAVKAVNTWLAGKIKCANCGYALTIKKTNTQAGRYFICSRRMNTHRCEGAGTIHASMMEQLILKELRYKLKQFPTLHPPIGSKANQMTAQIQTHITQLQNEAENLLKKLPQASEILAEYIESRITEIDKQKKNLIKEEALLEDEWKKQQGEQGIQNYEDKWDEITFDDKRIVADCLIEKILATHDKVVICWRV